MATPNELQAVAAAMNALRPEWQPRSLLTFLNRHHAHRPYRDLAVAAVWVATDPRTETPKLLNEHGPWWTAAGTTRTDPTPLPPRNLTCEDHGPHTGIDCPRCVAAAVPMPDTVRELVRGATLSGVT